MLKICEANGCKKPILIPSLHMPALCLDCAKKARARVDAYKKLKSDK